ncbi:MAG: hypothetical protein ABW000_23940 [Actinoplanes sp.]
MVDERRPPADVDPPGQWGQLCLRFHDLRRGAREFGWGDRFRKLAAASDGDLAEWLTLAEDIRVRREEALGVAMHSIDEYVAELARRGIAEQDERSRDYVCPDGRCPRRALALFDEAPTCDLLGQPMIKS